MANERFRKDWVVCAEPITEAGIAAGMPMRKCRRPICRDGESSRFDWMDGKECWRECK
jgi:hypothetical protein